MDTKQEILDALHDATNLDNDQVDTEYFAQLLDNILPKQCDMGGVSGSAYRDDLLTKMDSMNETGKFWFKKDHAKTVKMVLENVKVHIEDIYKKHYR